MTEAAPAKFDPGPQPELAWLPVDKCHVDHRYQRSLESDRSKALIKRIAERFRWSAFQAVLAVKDGKNGWLIVDGQHRCAAAQLCGVRHVPAVVVSAASVEEQAMAFVQANLDRVSINQYALFHARLAAGEVAAAELARLCKNASILIPRYPLPADKIGAGQTLALGTIARIARRQPPAVTALILRAVADAYRAIPGALRAAYFSAAEKVIQAQQPIDKPRAAEKITAFLKSKTLGELGTLIARHREMHGRNEIEAVAALFMAQVRHVDAAVSAVAAPDRRRLMAGR
jgi:ParB-like chromosome segregation protein Spo0J